MTEYQKEIIEKINSKLIQDAWYNIAKREDAFEFLQAVKLCHDIHNNIVFKDDFSAFKRVKPYKERIAEMKDIKEISYFIEWHKEQDVKFDYSHLPEPVFTPNDKKPKRRAV